MYAVRIQSHLLTNCRTDLDMCNFNIVFINIKHKITDGGTRTKCSQIRSNIGHNILLNELKH